MPLFVRWENMKNMKNMKIKMNLPLLDLSASPQVKTFIRNLYGLGPHYIRRSYWKVIVTLTQSYRNCYSNFLKTSLSVPRALLNILEGAA